MTFPDAQAWAIRAFHTRHPSVDDVARVIQESVSMTEVSLWKCQKEYQQAIDEIGAIGELLGLNPSTYMTHSPQQVAQMVKERALELHVIAAPQP